jgi:hypothetical protein
MGDVDREAILLATDLDRTMIWSTAALDLPPGCGGLPRLVDVETYKERAHSFVTERAASMLAAMNQAGALVPVTTRTVSQYERVRLPGPSPRHAVCLNGGRLLVDGVEDLDHTAHVASRLTAAAPLVEVRAQLAEVCAPAAEFVKALREADGTFCYVVLLEPNPPADWLAEVREVAQAAAWEVSVQGRKVYCVPEPLTKAHAIGVIRERLARTRLYAAGDSLLDADLLEAAEEGLMPRGSELDKSGWRRAHVQVTSATGVRAGEEVAAWLHAAVSG